MIKLGIERLIEDSKLQDQIKDRAVSLVAHPASVTRNLEHSMMALKKRTGLRLTSAFGPQHGLRGEKQDNMIESDDFIDPDLNIPVFSLYGQFRRPTEEMLASADVFLFDLQDVGCRIYTFLTTLFYFIEDLSKYPNKELWVLDRPNPAGRPIEGQKLDMNFKSFVGAAPIPMRHGLTLGEAALWYKDLIGSKCILKVVEMENYNIDMGPWFGWPMQDRAWVNPSPNMPKLGTARSYAGTVLIEGTHLSEGRGTTVPLEVIGGAGLNIEVIMKQMEAMNADVFKGVGVRSGFFEPTFHKFKGELCSALYLHAEDPLYNHDVYRPYRLVCCFLKALRQTHPDFNIFKEPPYEYETVKKPFDILSGDEFIRHWVNDPRSNYAALDAYLLKDEKAWVSEREKFLLY